MRQDHRRLTRVVVAGENMVPLWVLAGTAMAVPTRDLLERFRIGHPGLVLTLSLPLSLLLLFLSGRRGCCCFSVRFRSDVQPPSEAGSKSLDFQTEIVPCRLPMLASPLEYHTIIGGGAEHSKICKGYGQLFAVGAVRMNMVESMSRVI